MQIALKVLAVNTNYTYIVPFKDRTLLINPADFVTVDRFLTRQNRVPDLIINTHHHPDHTGGNQQLKNKYSCRILGGDPRIPGIDRKLSDGETLKNGSASLRIIHTPGHTRGSICLLIGQNLFTGDTLFTAGCGRVMEGTYRSLYSSLRRLAGMEPGIRIYGGHDYTRENLRFARSLFPEDLLIRSFLQRAQKIESPPGEPIITTLREEQKINPFLRAGSADLFARWRKRKDRF